MSRTFDYPPVTDQLLQEIVRGILSVEVIKRLNDKARAHLWKEDEAIGWLYQYFNSREEIDRMREKELGGSPIRRSTPLSTATSNPRSRMGSE